MNQDEAVITTNDDAASCKRSAVERGYWRDPYIQYFIRSMERKAPEINRGYFARVKGMHILLKQFLKKTDCHCQVINIGAGFDTTFWNLKDEGLVPDKFIELDFQGVTSRKCYYIKSRKQLLEKLQSEESEIQFNKWDLHSHRYHIVGVDLRNLNLLEQKLVECQIDKSVPTVFLAECVMVYMPGESTHNLLSWIAQQFTTAFFINYEQVNMGDRFGQVMVENLKTRGCALPGVEHCVSLHTQKQRFLTTGWTGAEALDMNDVYSSIDQAEIKSCEGLEMLETLQQELYGHYCVCWAYCDPLEHGLGRIHVKADHGYQTKGPMCG